MPSTAIEVLSPPGAIKPTGTWNVGVRAGDFVFVAGSVESIRRPVRCLRVRKPAYVKRS